MPCSCKAVGIASAMLPRLFFISRHDTDAPPIPSVVGNKAAGLVRLNHLKLRVPSALVIPTAVSRQYTERGALPDAVLTELADAIQLLAHAVREIAAKAE